MQDKGNNPLHFGGHEAEGCEERSNLPLSVANIARQKSRDSSICSPIIFPISDATFSCTSTSFRCGGEFATNLSHASYSVASNFLTFSSGKKFPPNRNIGLHARPYFYSCTTIPLRPRERHALRKVITSSCTSYPNAVSIQKTSSPSKPHTVTA